MRRLLAVGLSASLLGCAQAEPCEENLGAQTLDERIQLVVADQAVSAELADDEVERERGWRRRSCNREALLLVPDRPEPLAVWGCELAQAIDVIGLHEGTVAYVQRLEPCEAPCGGCPTVGDDITVDGVLEVPAGALDVEVGDAVDWP
ncbi:MAG: DUF192 domain-containing protein [Nannocystaceae bacterium]|nr:DUF192 domain-containing protein [bacterium]